MMPASKQVTSIQNWVGKNASVFPARFFICLRSRFGPAQLWHQQNAVMFQAQEQAVAHDHQADESARGYSHLP